MWTQVTAFEVGTVFSASGSFPLSFFLVFLAQQLLHLCSFSTRVKNIFQKCRCRARDHRSHERSSIRAYWDLMRIYKLVYLIIILRSPCTKWKHKVCGWSQENVYHSGSWAKLLLHECMAIEQELAIECRSMFNAIFTMLAVHFVFNLEYKRTFVFHTCARVRYEMSTLVPKPRNLRYRL